MPLDCLFIFNLLFKQYLHPKCKCSHNSLKQVKSGRPIHCQSLNRNSYSFIWTFYASFSKDTKCVLPHSLSHSTRQSSQGGSKIHRETKDESFLKIVTLLRRLPLLFNYLSGCCHFICFPPVSESLLTQASFFLILSKGSRNCSKWFNQAPTSQAFPSLCYFVGWDH